MKNEILSKLDELSKKTVAELYESEAAFIKARQSYLTDDQTKQFAFILGEAKEEKTKTAEEEKPAKKTKK